MRRPGRDRFLPECRGRRARADGLLAGAARHQDAGRAHGAARAERARRRAGSTAALGALASSIPACPRIPSTSWRSGSARLRRHDLVRSGRRRARGRAARVRRFKVFSCAESLGGVECLVCHPASMTHASVPREARLARLRRRAAAALGRHRGRRRPDRRPHGRWRGSARAIRIKKPAEREHAGAGRGAKRR